MYSLYGVTSEKKQMLLHDVSVRYDIYMCVCIYVYIHISLSTSLSLPLYGIARIDISESLGTEGGMNNLTS